MMYQMSIKGPRSIMLGSNKFSCAIKVAKNSSKDDVCVDVNASRGLVCGLSI